MHTFESEKYQAAFTPCLNSSIFTRYTALAIILPVSFLYLCSPTPFSHWFPPIYFSPPQSHKLGRIFPQRKPTCGRTSVLITMRHFWSIFMTRKALFNNSSTNSLQILTVLSFISRNSAISSIKRSDWVPFWIFVGCFWEK